METLIVNINKKSISEEITKILENYGESVSIFRFKNNIKKSKLNNHSADFLDLSGIWENTDITIETIRDKAWKRN
jgi:hypothetical protein